MNDRWDARIGRGDYFCGDGDSIEDAAIREAKEETGLNIYDQEFINFQQFIYDPAFWKHRHFMFLDYTCKTISIAVNLNDEAEEYIRISPKSALELPLDRYTRASIEKYLKM